MGECWSLLLPIWIVGIEINWKGAEKTAGEEGKEEEEDEEGKRERGGEGMRE
jgi:hypothetical protein